MFLKKDNSVKWKFLGIAFAMVIVLCLLGIFWLDKPLFLFLRNFNWSIWGIFDTIFASKIWLAASAIVAAIIFGKNLLKSKGKNKKNTNKFSLKRLIINFIEKSKHNYGFLIFCSILLSTVITGFLKYGLGRQRPIFYEALGQTGFYPFNSDWAFNSMPSGHTTASFAGLVMIGLLFPKIKWATWSLGIAIALSRICYGDHWPSDVLLGAFVGMVVADLVKSFFYKKN